MQLNTSTDYAIRIMLYLAKCNRIASSTELSKNIAVSQRYLLLIAAKLRDGGLLGVNAGPSGGYYLRKEASQISVYDVVVLLEGFTFGPQDEEEDKLLCDVYDALKAYWAADLRTITLDMLIGNDDFI
jgi:Rrf2 family protein